VVYQIHQAQAVQLDQTVQQVPLEVLLLLVQVDQAVHQALQDQMVLQEYLVLPEQVVHQVPQDQTVLQEYLLALEQAVRQVQVGPPALMAHQANQLVLVQADHQVQAVHPVLMAYQDNQLVQEHQVQVDQTALLG
jgi:hypothetical protein